jgi:hypothetical protein
MSDHIKKRCDETRERIDWLARLEERPFSLNEHYFRDYKGTCRNLVVTSLLILGPFRQIYGLLQGMASARQEFLPHG